MRVPERVTAAIAESIDYDVIARIDRPTSSEVEALRRLCDDCADTSPSPTQEREYWGVWRLEDGSRDESTTWRVHLPAAMGVPDES